jgi:autotransporter passenger strand-loop-strand repeat protein
VNIQVGYGEIAGQRLGAGALGASETYIDPYGYSQVVGALKGNEPSAAQQSAYSTLPANSPLSGSTLWLTTAQEKALGLLAANTPDIDGYVGFSSTYPFSYSPTATPAPGQYYFVGVVAHEITEIMGRDSFLGDVIAGTTSYSVMDLFRYAAPGTRQLGTGGPAYFSINSGNTNLDNWNTNSSGDRGDWAATAGNDAFLAFSPSDQSNGITPTDLTLMNVLGWDPQISTVASDNFVVLPVTVNSGQTYSVTSGQIDSGDTVLSGGTMFILSGGEADLTTVSSGGTEVVSAGGTDYGAQISGGEQDVFGYASGATVFTGGLQVVESGGTANDTIVSLGNQVISLGGTASHTLVSGGRQYVESGGVAYHTTIGPRSSCRPSDPPTRLSCRVLSLLQLAERLVAR